MTSLSMSGGEKLSKYSVRGGDVARLERFESLNTVRMAGARWKPIIRLVAHHAEAEIHPNGARGSAELSETGERFEGLPPSIVAAPAFAIRKPAVAIFMLEDCRFRADFENFATTCDQKLVSQEFGGEIENHLVSFLPYRYLYSSFELSNRSSVSRRRRKR
jgi:hypothetical protein